MASKYYAVKKGKVSGIYLNWNDCKAMVDGYPGAVYKSFKTIEEAEKLNDSAVVYRIVLKTRSNKNFAVERKMKKDFKLALDEAGIKIPYPQVEVHNE